MANVDLEKKYANIKSVQGRASTFSQNRSHVLTQKSLIAPLIPVHTYTRQSAHTQALSENIL